MILTVEQRAAGLKAIDEAKDAYINDLHKERALIKAAELFRADGITAWEEVERLKEECFEYEMLAARFQSLLSETLRELEWYANWTTWIHGRYEGGSFISWAVDDGGARAKAAIQRIQEGIAE
ncbi:hypothetical protein J27TS7_10750 [Paenibacillus dendritiformis]|uniref:hypothetical protein n=1 Tax=Paenibacillus dendritiformis TaxID=130049 RepID=UPI001B2F2D8F|nr:hypothetical protein [Paenibacillus dendritiformis]GIO71561.1 hypothetical protein J27TS7_10750 [Paenibacillus dendritiformis]